jgi:DNA-binding GntR family transcriptional regulator
MGYDEPPAADTSQVARIYEEIKWKIIYGRYRPGMNLSEATLARVCGASRTPVREALSRLSADGYVVSFPRRGFAIAPLTISMVRNMLQMRSILEMAGAELAAVHATRDEILRMQRAADYSDGSADENGYRLAIASNIEFHLTVARAARNDLLVDSVRSCLLQVYRVLSLGGDVARFEEGTAAQHHAIVDAIASRDPSRAREAIERHLNRGADVIMGDLINGRIRGVACQ